MKLLNQAAQGVRWTATAGVVTNTAEMLRMLVLAYFLAPADFGLMGMAAVAIGFAQMYMDLGMGAAIIHRQDATKAQLSSLYWLSVATGVLAFLVIWLASPPIADLFREPRLVSVLRVAGVVFIFASVSNQFATLLQRDLMFRTLAAQEIISSLAAFLAGITLAAMGFGVWSLVAAYLVSTGLRAVFLLGVGMSRYRPLLHFSRADLRGFVRFGVFQLGEKTINYINHRLDHILVGRLLGAQGLGYYTFAFHLAARPLSQINPIVTRVAFPVFSKLQNDNDKLRTGYVKLVGFLSSINAPILIGLAAVAPFAVPLLFGEKWQPSVVLIQILSLMSLLRSIGNPIGSLQLAKGRADLGFKWNLFLLCASVPAIYAGARLYGATGVALSLLLLQLSLAVPVYVFTVRPLIGPCGREYAAAVLKPIAVALAMGIIVAALPVLLKIPHATSVAAQVAVGAIIYFALLARFNRGFLADLHRFVFSH